MKGQYPHTLKFNLAWVARVSKSEFVRAQAHLADMYDIDLEAEYDRCQAEIEDGNYSPEKSESNGDTPAAITEDRKDKRHGSGGGHSRRKSAGNSQSAARPVVSGPDQQGDADQTEVPPADNSDKEEKGAAD